jgi:hypothetical protein
MSNQLILETTTCQHDKTQHSQQTNTHDPGGIQTHNLSKQVAADIHRSAATGTDIVLNTLYNKNNNNELRYCCCYKVNLPHRLSHIC